MNATTASRDGGMAAMGRRLWARLRFFGDDLLIAAVVMSAMTYVFYFGLVSSIGATRAISVEFAVTAIAVDVTAELGRLEAAHACDVSITTIKRRLKAGAFPHARQVGLDRSWVIPVQDLVDAGLLPASSLALPAIRSGADEPTRAPGGPSAARLAEAAAEIRGLRETLAQAKEEIAFLRGLLAEGRAA